MAPVGTCRPVLAADLLQIVSNKNGHPPGQMQRLQEVSYHWTQVMAGFPWLLIMYCGHGQRPGLLRLPLVDPSRERTA